MRRADEIRLGGSYTNVPLTPGEEPALLPNPSVPPPSNGSAMRRVLRRARDGVALNVDEAAIAMTARGEDLAELCRSAARVRDAGLESAGRRGAGGRLPVSYSRKVFIPVTHLCRDACRYCTFVTVPGGKRYHTAECSVAAGKEVTTIDRGGLAGLQPCRLCSPSPT